MSGYGVVKVHKNGDRPIDLGALRRRAEEVLSGLGSDGDKFSVEGVRSFIYELEVHQIELEMQNEGLYQAQEELQAARDKYADLYDFAPIGYLTIGKDGQILEANLTAAELVGMKRGVLVGQSLSRLIAKEDQDVYYKHRRAVLVASNPQTCDIRMVKQGGAPFDVHMQSVGIPDDDRPATKWRTVISDVTERKRITQELARTLEQQHGLNLILRALQAAQTPVQVLEVAIDQVLQISWLGMQASAAAFLLRRRQLHKVVSRNLPPAIDQGCAQVALGQCLCGRVAQTGKPIIGTHLEEIAPEYAQWHEHSEGMLGHGHAVFPLKWQSQILGVLCFYLVAGDELDEYRRDFLEAVASIVATALGRRNDYTSRGLA